MQDFQIQADQATSLNRYPDVFTAVKQFTEKHMVIHPKILSFGCSTGQEPVTLATEYFPNSEIVGLDTSLSAIEVARQQRNLNGRIIYEVSTPDTIKKNGPFDIIFAMSVLCRWPDLKNVKDSSEIFPYEQFVDIVRVLDQNLKLGGLMVIFNSNYLFSSTELIFNYETALIPWIKNNGFVTRFDRAGREIENYKGNDVVYRKLVDYGFQKDGRTLRFISSLGNPLGSIHISH